MSTWTWPPTVTALEALCVAIALVGLIASAYDIERAVREAKYHWLPNERAERGIARFGLLKAVCLGLATVTVLLMGAISIRIPQTVRTSEGIWIADILAVCFIFIEVIIVTVIGIRDMERWFVQGFVWFVRERTPDDPPPHQAPTAPIQAPPENP